MNGSIPIEKSAVLHSNTKAIMRPDDRVAIFCISIDKNVAVKPFTIKLSEASFVVNCPLLFLGLSNH